MKQWRNLKSLLFVSYFQSNSVQLILTIVVINANNFLFVVITFYQSVYIVFRIYLYKRKLFSFWLTEMKIYARILQLTNDNSSHSLKIQHSIECSLSVQWCRMFSYIFNKRFTSPLYFLKYHQSNKCFIKAAHGCTKNKR